MISLHPAPKCSRSCEDKFGKKTQEKWKWTNCHCTNCCPILLEMQNVYLILILFVGPSEGLVEPGVSPSKRLCDISPVNCSTDISCESTHLNFGDDNHSSSASDSSSSSSSSSSSLNATPMLLGELPRHPFRSKFTPPRSPLAGPSTSQNHPRTIGNSPSCFTFAPVRD